MKFSVQDKLIDSKDYLEIFETAKGLGFDGVEITHFDGPIDLEMSQLILRASDQVGIEVSAVCGGYTHWIGDFNETNRLIAVDGIMTSLKHTAEFSAQGLIAPAAYGLFSKRLPPFTPPRDEIGDHKALLDSLNRIAEAAEKYNVTLFLEPLNRYEDHMLNTVSQAVSLIKEIGSNQIKVLADFFHMGIEEANITETIANYYEDIGYFHLADSNRLEPGKGHTDFTTPFTQLKKNQYKGFLSLECGLSKEGTTSLHETMSFLKGINKVNI